MVTLITIVHVIIGIFLILMVLLQGGKGAGLGAAFGGSSQTVFGASGATSFLAKLTAFAAALFVITSISLSYFSSKSESALAKYSTKKAVKTEKTDAPSLIPSADGGLNVSNISIDASSVQENNNDTDKK